MTKALHDITKLHDLSLQLEQIHAKTKFTEATIKGQFHTAHFELKISNHQYPNALFNVTPIHLK